mgnify:CR=1 FL=1
MSKTITKGKEVIKSKKAEIPKSTEVKQVVKEPDITAKNHIQDYKGRLLCPNCQNILTQIKDSDYKCNVCGKGFSFFT